MLQPVLIFAASAKRQAKGGVVTLSRGLIELWDTNRFRKELRDNFVKTSSSHEPVTFTQDDKTDSFDYDKGFNIDEVYDSPDDSLSEMGKKCTKCGSPVFRDFCGSCGKEAT